VAVTPTGSLPSPRWRWWARAVMAATVVLVVSAALAPHPLQPEDPTFQSPLAAPPALSGLLAVAGAASVVILLVGLLAAAGSLVVRFRRARGLERQHLRWLALAAALSAVMLLAAVASAVLGAPLGVVLIAAGISVAVLPLATGAAILRNRLYDLDRIISRTLAYGSSRSCLAWGTPGWSLGWGGCCPRAQAWSWPPPPWPWRRCSNRCAAGSRPSSTAASTAAATTPPRQSPPSAPTCATRSLYV
jgi:hypothetical protein